jgi:glutathione S-transferase
MLSGLPSECMQMKLYGYRNGRTLRALWALEEVGAAYEYVEVDVMRGAGRQPAFLQINPAGKVPVLVDDGQVIAESAAICMHLADKFPESELLPRVGTAERAQCYRWISFVLTELDAPLWLIAKHRFALPKDKRVAGVVETAMWEFCEAAKILATGITDGHLVHDRFTVADILAGHVLLWAKSARISNTEAKLERYLDVLLTREPLRIAQHRAASAT